MWYEIAHRLRDHRQGSIGSPPRFGGKLKLGIIPFEADIPVWPLASFMIYDRELVVAETITGEQRLADPDEVALYDEFFDLLRDAAATGRDAITIIQRALAQQTQ